MSKFVLDDGREFKVTSSITQTDTHWIIDGESVAKEGPIALHTFMTSPDGTIISGRRGNNSHIDANGKEYMINGDWITGHGDEVMLTIFDTDPIEKIRRYIGRGGYGKDGDEEYRFVLLKDMSDAWIRGSISYCRISDENTYADIYERELSYREENGIIIEDK